MERGKVKLIFDKFVTVLLLIALTFCLGKSLAWHQYGLSLLSLGFMAMYSYDLFRVKNKG